MRIQVLCGLLIFFAGCSSGTIVEQGPERQPVIDNWENMYVYLSPPSNYQVIGIVTGKGRGFSDEGKMENAMEGMKEEARDAGATGVLLQTAGTATVGAIDTATWTSTGSGGFGFGASIPIVRGYATGLAIYVPADAANFTQALQVHESKCNALSAQEEDFEQNLKAAKKAGAKTSIEVAKHTLEVVQNAEDSEFCGRDTWYAKKMSANQQLMEKMRSEETASQTAIKNAEELNHDAECLAAAKKNDLAMWQKLACK